MYILNDIHIGTARKAGATPASAEALKQYIQSEFRRLTEMCSGHLCILGDLFDRFTVETTDLLGAYTTLANYLDKHNKVTLVAGNHDWSPKDSKTSSFHLLAHILKMQYPDAVQVITHEEGLTEVEPGVSAIPHMPNQELFELELSKVAGGTTLLLHCNILSPFAEHSDHSLNLTQPLVDALLEKGVRVISAHEHASRSLYRGRVYVIGNQITASVSDAINDLNKQKSFIQLEGGVISEIESQDLTEVFAKIDWREVDDASPDLRFIRVGGDATAAEAADAVAAVARLRQRHNAFVITNAVSVEGMTTEMESLSLEQVRSFDVLNALLELLDVTEQQVIRKVLKC